MNFTHFPTFVLSIYSKYYDAMLRIHPGNKALLNFKKDIATEYDKRNEDTKNNNLRK